MTDTKTYFRMTNSGYCGLVGYFIPVYSMKTNPPAGKGWYAAKLLSGKEIWIRKSECIILERS